MSSQRRSASSRKQQRDYCPPVAKVKPVKHVKTWDGTSTVTKPTLAYNSLTDPSLAHYYGQRKQREFLQQSGIVAPDGRIVHTSKAYSRVIVAEQVFGSAEDDDFNRNEDEFHLRMQLRARTAISREKMLNDTKVNKMRIAEHDALLRRKQERQKLEDRCWHSDYKGRYHTQSKPRVDWKTLQYVQPEDQVVTTSVRPAGTQSQLTNTTDMTSTTLDSTYSSTRRSRSSSRASSRSSHPPSSVASPKKAESRSSTPARHSNHSSPSRSRSPSYSSSFASSRSRSPSNSSRRSSPRD